MEFFDKVFNWIEQLSAKVGSFDVKAYFFIVLGIILAVGIIVGFTFFDSTRYKLLKASKRIINYLKNIDNVDDDNVAEFTERCFSDSVPKSLRDTWVEFLGVRFGYPSEIISQQNVYDKEIKKADNMRPSIFLTIGLILVGLFAFFGYGALEKTGMSVIIFLGLVLVAVIYIILVIISKSLNKKSINAFFEMQEDIDAKVNLPIETNYSTDGSPLNEAASIIDEIIAKNMSRDVESGYEEVVADMGNPVVINPVEKQFVLRQTPVYVAPEYNEQKVIPTVPKIKKRLFKKVQKEEPVKVVEEEKQDIVPVKEEKKVEEKKTTKKRVTKKENKPVEEKAAPVVQEQKVVEPKVEDYVETIPEHSKSDFDDSMDEVMPVAVPQTEENKETPVVEEKTIVEDVIKEDEIKEPVVEEPKEEVPLKDDIAENIVEEPITENVEVEVKTPDTQSTVVENIVEQENDIVQEAEDTNEDVLSDVVEVPEIHLQTISNDLEEDNLDEDSENTLENTNINFGGSIGIKDVMSTDAFGGSVLPPKSENTDKNKKKTKKK